jgi:hypothetical protein
MNDVAKLTLMILHRISDFLQTLPEDQLVDIAEGRATLTYHPYGAPAPVSPTPVSSRRRPTTRQTKPTKDMTEVVEALDRMHSREDGERYLGAMGVADLRAVATQLEMGGVSKDRKADLVAKLVERTIGSRLNSAAIRQL